MRMLKYVAILVLTSFLVACGHGYKGTTWKLTEIDTGKEPQRLAMMGMVFQPRIPDITLEIGSNTLSKNGESTTYDKVTVKKIDGKKHLIFIQNKKEELVFEIRDDNTLIVSEGREKKIFTRVEK